MHRYLAWPSHARRIPPRFIRYPLANLGALTYGGAFSPLGSKGGATALGGCLGVREAYGGAQLVELLWRRQGDADGRLPLDPRGPAPPRGVGICRPERRQPALADTTPTLHGFEGFTA